MPSKFDHLKGHIEHAVTESGGPDFSHLAGHIQVHPKPLETKRAPGKLDDAIDQILGGKEK